MVPLRYLFCALLAGLALSACSGQSKDGVSPPSPAVAPTTEAVIWTRSGANKTRTRSLIDNCYAFAQGRIAHDTRIESERSLGFDTSSGGLGLIELRARMNAYERNRRFPLLVRECMKSEGSVGR